MTILDVSGRLERCCDLARSPQRMRRAEAALEMKTIGAAEDVRSVPELRAAWRDAARAIFLHLIGDPEEEVRLAALSAWSEAEGVPPDLPIGEILSDPSPALRSAAIQTLRDRGGAEHAAVLAPVVMDGERDPRLRYQALLAAARLSPDRGMDLALALLREGRPVLCHGALRVLQEMEWSGDRIRRIIETLSEVSGIVPGPLLDLIASRAAHAFPEAVRRALAARDPQVRAEAVARIPSTFPAEAVDLLAPLLEDPSPQTCAAAFAGIRKLDPRRALASARRAVRDEYAEVRIEAARILAACPDPDLIDDLLPLACDRIAPIRATAIAAIAAYDDPRVLSELISSLDDEDPSIRASALAILRGERGPVPCLARLPAGPRGAAPWEPIRAEVERIQRWAVATGQELLGRPVSVRSFRQGLGRTIRTPKDGAIVIDVTDSPVTSGHPHGADIMKGLALHEIGHHLCDFRARGFRSADGTARAEGVGEIFDILLDERLERILRSRRSAWGPLFDRLASYAFSQPAHPVPLEAYARFLDLPPAEVRDAVARRALPGRLLPVRPDTPAQVELAGRDIFRLPGALPPLIAFLWALRCGFDAREHPNPRVADAIAAVPSNLKRIDHAAVLAVARAIGDAIGRGERCKRDIESLRELARLHAEVFRGLRRILDQLEAIERLPSDARIENPGVRIRAAPGRTAPAPRSAPLPVPSGLRPSPRARADLNPAREFDRLAKEIPIAFDAERHAQVVARIRAPIQRLRASLRLLGRRTVDEPGSRRGHRVDIARARWAILRRDPNLLVSSRDEIRPDLYLGLLIDRSGSMRGKKIDLARAFGVLVAESAKGLPGIEGHVSAFDGDTFFPLGDFRRNAVAAIEATGGNNDAGGLARAAELALRSGKRNKLIIMVSDGEPAECTVEALRRLVERLTRTSGIVCVQAAVDRIKEVAFPHYVDLTQYPFDEAVRRFGELIVKLTAGWR